LSLITVGANTFGTLDFFPDVSTPIKYAVTVAGITGTPAYSVHIRLEVL